MYKLYFAVTACDSASALEQSHDHDKRFHDQCDFTSESFRLR